MSSVVIPAHNEAAVVGRLLRALSADATSDLDIVVVANGCTDDTVAVAESFGPRVRVVSTPEPSKFKAMRLGDQHALGFPRLYIDADVVIDAAGVRALSEVLSRPGVLAAAPTRVLGTDGASWIVRWYYDVWKQLPTVVSGLYGRGVIAVSAEGHARLQATPEMMADDLAASVAFAVDETVIVADAVVVVETPRTMADLVRRRVRAATSIAQLHEHTPDAVDSSRTSKSDLLGIVRRKPLSAAKLGVFLGVTLVARRRSRAAVRKGDFTTWLRDESSRTVSPTSDNSPSAQTAKLAAVSAARPADAGQVGNGG